MKMKRMFAAATQARVLELFVYTVIGESWYDDGVTPTSVQTAIKNAGAIDKIVVHINSPGGDCFDGTAIHNILRQQNVPVTTIIEGLAASAAFTIAMAGDVIQVCDGAMMMLHNAWTFAMGDSKELRKTADLLDKVSGTMCDVYAKRSGMESAAVQQLMDEETWLSPQEAIDKGFATELLSTTPEKSKESKALAAQFDISKFCSKVPDKLKAGVTIEKQESGDPDGDGDNDSLVTSALNSAADLCSSYQQTLTTAVANYDEESLEAVVADGAILIPTVQAAIAAAQKELDEDEGTGEGAEQVATTVPAAAAIDTAQIEDSNYRERMMLELS
jgi:ATP-dependent protease ClpP protease subunit